MKTWLKAVLWIIPIIISIFALVVATSYKTAQENTASWLPFFSAIPVWLGDFLSNRYVLFLLTAVVFSYLSYRITRFALERRITAAYQHGLDEGKPSENILGSIIDKTQIVQRKSLNPPTIDQLIYSIREVVGALSAPGVLDDETVGRNMGKIKQEHGVWHILANYNLRKSFVTVVEKARDARQEVGNSVYNVADDYPADRREHHVTSLQNSSERLIEQLNSQASRMKVRPNG